MKVLSFIAMFFTLFTYINSLFFHLKRKMTKCFLEELYSSNMAMIKYTIDKTENFTEDELAVIFAQTTIEVTFDEDQSNILSRDIVNPTGKFSFTAKKDGHYRICVNTGALFAKENYILFMNLEIMSDNMDEPSLSSIIKKEEINDVHKKVDKIIKKADRYISKQQKMIKIEDMESNNIIKLQKTFYYMTIFQIILVLIIGVYQVFNLKRYIEKTQL